MMASPTRAIEAPERDVGLRRGFLDEDGGGDEVGRRAQAADREVFDRASRLDAVVGVGGDGVFAQRIAFDRGPLSSNYTGQNASSLLRQRARPRRSYLHRSAT